MDSKVTIAHDIALGVIVALVSGIMTFFGSNYVHKNHMTEVDTKHMVNNFIHISEMKAGEKLKIISVIQAEHGVKLDMILKKLNKSF